MTSKFTIEHHIIDIGICWNERESSRDMLGKTGGTRKRDVASSHLLHSKALFLFATFYYEFNFIQAKFECWWELLLIFSLSLDHMGSQICVFLIAHSLVLLLCTAFLVWLDPAFWELLMTELAFNFGLIGCWQYICMYIPDLWISRGPLNTIYGDRWWKGGISQLNAGWKVCMYSMVE